MLQMNHLQTYLKFRLLKKKREKKKQDTGEPVQVSSEQAAADAAAEVKRKRKRTKKRKQEFLESKTTLMCTSLVLPGDDPEPTKEEVSQFFAKCGLLKKRRQW